MQKIGFCERYMLTTAVLNRTKEMTRRLEKALERAVEDYKKKYGEEPVIKYQEWVREGNFLRVHCEHGLLSFQTRYKLGEVVAVAQSYETLANSSYLDKMVVPANNPVKCEFKKEYCNPGWSNKMFVRPDLMPHQIQITDIKIERLQDISDEDCLKEGIKQTFSGSYCFEYTGKHGFGYTFSDSPKKAFASLIDRISGKGTWQSNPFVVVYEFKLVK